MDKLGRYHVQRKVEAANGPMYVASEAGSGRAATLKLVRFTEDTSSDERARLWRSLYDEVRAAAQLQHPNIAQVFEVFQHEGKTWIATEMATDKNLASLLAEGTPLPENTIVEVLRQTADALDYAHGKGLLHHTVRPSNLGVQANGAVRVFGFGLAQYFLETEEGSTTADFAYLAPELIRGRTLTQRSDQFSLAAIAYEMLTGEAPFQGTADQIRAGIVEQDPLPADGLNPAIGPAAARILGRGLAKKPEDRYPNCRELVEALLRALPKVKGSGSAESGKSKSGSGGRASVKSIASKSRTDVDTLMQELVAELAGSPERSAPEAREQESPAPRKQEGQPAEANTESSEDAAPVGPPEAKEPLWDLELAEPAPAGIKPVEKEVPDADEGDGRKAAILLAVSVVIAIAAGSWLYFGYGFGQTETPPTVISEAPSLAWATETVPPGAPGTAYRHILEAEGGAAPLRWEVSEGDLPPGIVLDPATGLLEGTPRVVGAYPVAITVSDAADQQVTRKLNLRVQSDLAVSTPGVLPSGVVGQLYQHKVEAEGGSEPFTWEVADGLLPAGLTLNSDGLIVGRPRDPGPFRFQARVSDSSQTSTVRGFELRVGSGLTLLSAPELPSSSAGSSYSHRLSAGGGAPPLRWSVTGGSLPSGMSLGSTSGIISGTPSGSGRSNFEVTVRDGAGATAVQSFQLDVQSALQLVTRADLPDANLNRVYSKPLELQGGNWPYRWSLAGGSLPPGLELDESSGTIRGTPTVAGNYEFDVQVRDAFRAATTKRFELEVTTMLEIRTAYDLPEAVGPAAYRQTLQASGGQPPYLWTVSDGILPPQFELDSTTGILSGVPTTRGEHRFTVEVSDGSGTKANRLFRLSVIPALRFSGGTLPPAIAGERYTQALAVTGGQAPHAWTLQEGDLPEGVALDESTGVVEGTPPAPGKYRFAVQVADSGEATTRQFFELQVRPPAPGEMIWRGELPKDAVLIIQDGRYASNGTVTGALPGVPIKIDLEPKEGLTVVTAPARSNNWKVLVINASQPQTEIIIRWTPLSSQ